MRMRYVDVTGHRISSILEKGLRTVLPLAYNNEILYIEQRCQ
jgi:hypothetical protein